MKVKINNYQIIKEAELEFKPGVTVIIGSSNNGKSSVIRAIESAINNKGGSDFINYDAESCEVTIEDLGQKIIWSKNLNSTKSYYDINGQVLNKIGQKQLDEVGQLLNMSEVQINNDKFRLNFWKQLDYPFLVGKTHYQLFDFISKSKDQEIISSLEGKTAEGIKTTKTDLADLNSKINLKVTDINRVAEEIKALTKFDDFDLAKFESMIKIYDVLDSQLATYKETARREAESREAYFKANAKLTEYNKLFHLCEGLIEHITDYETYLGALKSESAIKKSLSNIEATIKRNETKLASLKKVMKELDVTNKLFSDISNVILERNNLLDEINDASQLMFILDDKIEKTKVALDSFDVCPFCGSPLENHEVHNE